VVAVRQLRKVLRRPVYVVSAFVQPVLFVLMFRYVFGGAIHTGSVDYVDFVMPGIMVQTAIFGALITGMGLTEDMAAGVVDRFRSLPMARSAVLVGRTAADLVVNGLTLVVMVLVGLAVGFRPSGAAYELVLAFVLVLAFAYVFSWISAWVGLLVREPETAQSAGFLWVLPLTFVSSAFGADRCHARRRAGLRRRQSRDRRRRRRASADHGPGRRAALRPPDPRVARGPAARIRALGRARVPPRLNGVRSGSTRRERLARGGSRGLT
jgi:ABC-type transport system involved in cytochrome c biogenesis permease component